MRRPRSGSSSSSGPVASADHASATVDALARRAGRCALERLRRSPQPHAASPCSRKAMRACATVIRPASRLHRSRRNPRPLARRTARSVRRWSAISATAVVWAYPVRSSPSTVATPWFQPLSAHCQVSSSRLPRARTSRSDGVTRLAAINDPRRRLDERARVGRPAPALALVAGTGQRKPAMCDRRTRGRASPHRLRGGALRARRWSARRGDRDDSSNPPSGR